MRFLLDENVDERVGQILERRGHHVTLAREILAPGTPDQLVAAAAAERDAIVVTSDRDFLRIVSRRSPDNRLEWRRVGRVSLSCVPRRAPSRIEQAIELIEWEHEFARRQADPRVIVDVGGDMIRIER